MSGHGHHPLHAQLGLAEGMRVGLDDPPPEFVGLTLMPVPAGVSLATRIAGNMDVVIGFYEQRRELEKRLPVLRRRIPDDGAIWVAWPTKASRMPTDLDEDTVREAAVAEDLVGTIVCPIDEGWVGMKLVLEDSPSADG